MSHTSASVPPSLGAMGLYLLVCESRTARLPTLPKSVPSRLVTWEMRPPSQTLLPTCLMALTRPSTIGVLSGFWEGNASTAPLARRRPAAVENSNKRVLLIPISFFSWAEEERTKPPPRYVRDGGIIHRLCEQAHRLGVAHHQERYLTNNFLDLRRREVRRTRERRSSHSGHSRKSECRLLHNSVGYKGLVQGAFSEQRKECDVRCHSSCWRCWGQP